MGEQSINRGLMIAGGLLGLGLLGYLFFREKEEATEEAEFTVVETPVKAEKPKPVVIKKPKQEPRIVAKQKEENPIAEKKKEIAVKAQALTEPNDDFPLKLGSEGERVTQLQVYLLKNHGTAGLVSNVFDAITEERVLRFLKVKEVSEKLFQERNMANIKKKKDYARKKKH